MVEVSERGTVCWILSAICESPNEQQRMELCDELGNFAQHTSHPWLLINWRFDTRSVEERQNCSNHLARRCTNFNNWIENN